MIDRDVLLKAGADLYRVFWMDVCEEVGLRAPDFDSIEVPSERTEDLLITSAYFVGRLEESWHTPLSLIFYHGGVDEEADFIYYAMMEALGHGVGLFNDPWCDYLEKAGRVLDKDFSDVPFYYEFNSLRSEVWRDLQKWLEEESDDPAKAGRAFGEVVQFSTRFGTGDTLSGQGEIVGVFTDRFVGGKPRFRFVVRLDDKNGSSLITVLDVDIHD